MENKSIDFSNNFSTFDFINTENKKPKIKSVKSMESLCSEMISKKSQRVLQNNI